MQHLELAFSTTLARCELPLLMLFVNVTVLISHCTDGYGIVLYCTVQYSTLTSRMHCTGIIEAQRNAPICRT